MATPFNVLKFWTEYRPDGVDEAGNPKLRSVDMVAYAPIGKANMQTMIEAVSRISKVKPMDPGDQNEAIRMAHARWNTIKPLYDSWKHGNEAPEVGTPLGAWPGVTSEQVQALKAMGLRTIEDIRDASEGIVTRFPFPNARALQVQADLFLKSFAADKTSKDLQDMRDQLAERDTQLEEMRKIVLELQEQQASVRQKKDKQAA